MQPGHTGSPGTPMLDGTGPESKQNRGLPCTIHYYKRSGIRQLSSDVAMFFM